MHDYGVADGFAFGIQGPLYAQRPDVFPMRQRRAPRLMREAEFELAVPLVGIGGSRWQQGGYRFVMHEALRIGSESPCYGERQTAINSRTPSASISAPAPPAMISPRLITQ